MQAYKFDAEQTAKQCIQWMQNWMQQNGNDTTKVVIGISGGKDSSVVAALACAAFGKERVLGVMMPNGTQTDIEDSVALVQHLGIPHVTINIQQAFDGLTKAIDDSLYVIGQGSSATSPQYRSNTPARLRMTTLYGVGAIIGNARVVNTCNRSEDVQGYSTHYGDSAGDFAPVAKLTTEEVVAIGDYLGLPLTLTHKVPSDGMCGKTDEDNLGWTYHEINEVIRKNVQGPHYEAILKKYKGSQFKLKMVQLPAFLPELPDFFKENFGW